MGYKPQAGEVPGEKRSCGALVRKRVLTAVHYTQRGWSLWAALSGKVGGQGSPSRPTPPNQVSASAEVLLSDLKEEGPLPSLPAPPHVVTPYLVSGPRG